MPKKPNRKISGVQFRIKDGEIYFSPKFKALYKESFVAGSKIISENKLNVNKILEEFNYDHGESNEFVTAKMSFYALLSTGNFLHCMKCEQKHLAALLIGKSANDRARRTGELFNLEKTLGCYNDARA